MPVRQKLSLHPLEHLLTNSSTENVAGKTKQAAGVGAKEAERKAEDVKNEAGRKAQDAKDAVKDASK